MIPQITKNRLLRLLILTVALTGCFESPKNENDSVQLLFYLTLDRDIYLDTSYGEPPQIAVWLENPENGQTRNVWVAYRTGKNDWIGKSYCAVCLPYWQHINGRTEKDKRYKVIDDEHIQAYTMATPPNDLITATAEVPKGSQWNYYIEVNAAGDFNEAFPSRHPNGYPDLQGNGQPSIIYKGSIIAEKGHEDVPKIIGRTDQWQPVENIIKDLNGMTTAAQLLTQMKVTCE